MSCENPLFVLIPLFSKEYSLPEEDLSTKIKEWCNYHKTDLPVVAGYVEICQLFTIKEVEDFLFSNDSFTGYWSNLLLRTIQKYHKGDIKELKFKGLPLKNCMNSVTAKRAIKNF